MIMNTKPPVKASHGFSLVELSIVLVILGLLTGGILAGKSLIEASELRSVSKEATNYITAVHTFRDKYFSLPGDMTNATVFWGTAGGSTGTDYNCGKKKSTDTKTCNGNGNGYIDPTVVDPATATVYEDMRSWQHLANAGLIEGTYNGTYYAPSWSVVLGVNLPKSRFTNGFWWFGSVVPHMNVMEIAASPAWDGLLTSANAYNIDTKMDDGMPLTGKITSWDLGDQKCVTTATQVYTLTNTDAHVCGMDFAVFQ